MGIPLVRRVETTFHRLSTLHVALGIPLVRRVETTLVFFQVTPALLGIPLVRRVETTIIPKGERGAVVLLMGKYS